MTVPTVRGPMPPSRLAMSPYASTRPSGIVETRSSTRSAWSSSGTGVLSVLGLARVDLPQVGEYAALDVRDVREPRAQREPGRLRRAGADLAVDEDPSVGGQLVEGLPRAEEVEVDGHCAGDRGDGALLVAAHVHEQRRIRPGQLLGHLVDRHRGQVALVVGGGARHAAELDVVDELGDRRVLAADRAV